MTAAYYVIQNNQAVAFIDVEDDSQIAETVAAAQQAGLCPPGPYTIEPFVEEG